MHFEAKQSKVVREEGDYFLNVGPGFKNKFVLIYIEHTKDIKKHARYKVAGSVAHYFSS